MSHYYVYCTLVRLRLDYFADIFYVIKIKMNFEFREITLSLLVLFFLLFNFLLTFVANRVIWSGVCEMPQILKIWFLKKQEAFLPHRKNIAF